jgi:uncharacterized protein (DUF952 family)
MLLYHVVTPPQWEKWSANDHYESPTFHQEGFIHLCTPEQLAGVIARYYSHEKELLLLHLDADLLEAPLKWEAATNDELFPHLFGPIDKKAVVKVAAPAF